MNRTDIVKSNAEANRLLTHRGWYPYHVWVEDAKAGAAEIFRVLAKDSYTAHLYAQEQYGDEGVTIHVLGLGE